MTWSIIARDLHTGQIGIAVATRFFAVGARVPHIAPGIGGVATQALVNPYYGIDGVKLLREGREPREVVRDADCRRRRPRGPAASCHGYQGPDRRAYRRRMRRLVRPHSRRRLFARRQHAGGRRRARRYRAGIYRQCQPALCAAADRGHEGRRSRRRRQARQAVGRAGDPWRGGMVRSRSARRRPYRSPCRTRAAGTGQPRALGAFPPVPADAEEPGRDHRPRRHRRPHRGGDGCASHDGEPADRNRGPARRLPRRRRPHHACGRQRRPQRRQRRDARTGRRIRLRQERDVARHHGAVVEGIPPRSPVRSASTASICSTCPTKPCATCAATGSR